MDADTSMSCRGSVKANQNLGMKDVLRTLISMPLARRYSTGPTGSFLLLGGWSDWVGLGYGQAGVGCIYMRVCI